MGTKTRSEFEWPQLFWAVSSLWKDWRCRPTQFQMAAVDTINRPGDTYPSEKFRGFTQLLVVGAECYKLQSCEFWARVVSHEEWAPKRAGPGKIGRTSPEVRTFPEPATQQVLFNAVPKEIWASYLLTWRCSLFLASTRGRTGPNEPNLELVVPAWA